MKTKTKAVTLETMDERPLNFSNSVSTTKQPHKQCDRIDNKKTGLLRVSVMRASVNAQHQKLMSSLNRSSAAACYHGKDKQLDEHSLVKQLQSLGQMFAPRRKVNSTQSDSNDISEESLQINNSTQVNNKKTKPTVVAMKLKEKKELFESLNYVLPIEKFNNFKVLIPKSKLHLITKDGEKVVVEYPGKRLNTKEIPNVSLTTTSPMEHGGGSALKRRHATTRDVLDLFAANTRKPYGNRSSQLRRRWRNEDDYFVYVTGRRKFYVDKEDGKIWYYYTTEAPRGTIAEAEYSSIVNNLERNIFQEQPSCLSVDPPSSREFTNTYPLFNATEESTSKQYPEFKNIRVRLMEDGETFESRPNRKFTIHSTRFGSFIERYRPDMKRGPRTRSFREREQQKLVELLEKIPNQFLPNRSRFGILRGSIQYIQSLQKRIRDELGICQKEDNDPLAFINDVCKQADELVKLSEPIQQQIIERNRVEPTQTPQSPPCARTPYEPTLSPLEEQENLSEGMELCDALYQHLFEYLCSPSSAHDRCLDQPDPMETSAYSPTNECNMSALSCIDVENMPSDERQQHCFGGSEPMYNIANNFETFVNLEGRLQFNYNDVNLNTLIGKREQTPSLGTCEAVTTTTNNTIDETTFKQVEMYTNPQQQQQYYHQQQQQQQQQHQGEEMSWDSLLDLDDSQLAGEDELFCDVVKEHQLLTHDEDDVSLWSSYCL